MIRDKTEIKSLGLDSEGTVRGRLLRGIITDDPKNWPKYARFEIWEDGRDFPLISTTSTTLVVEGDVTEYVAAGDEILVRDSAAADGTYTVGTPISYASGLTTITVDGPVSSGTITDASVASIRVVRPSRWQTFNIQAQTTGANGTITIIGVTGYGPPTQPICECDMFLIGDEVLIAGSTDGINDGLYNCRADFTDDSGQRTIYLDGFLNAAATLGQVTLQLPPPQRVKGYGMAVLRWYRAELLADCIVHARPIDSRGRWFEIIAADVGPDDIV